MFLVQTKIVFDAQVESKRWQNLWRIPQSLYCVYTSHKFESQFFYLSVYHTIREFLKHKIFIQIFFSVCNISYDRSSYGEAHKRSRNVWNMMITIR